MESDQGINDLPRTPSLETSRTLQKSSTIEVIREVSLDRPPSCALFDFDGTLSLIREGWLDVMIAMMVEVLKQTGTQETEVELTRLTTQFVKELTGRQTIYQMIRLGEEVAARGTRPLEPMAYKKEFLERLMRKIRGRRESLRSEAREPREMMVPFAREALEGLRARDVDLYLASGTDEEYVREEVKLLGLEAFFGDHIYGAVADYKHSSKRLAIERILRENEIDGSVLIGFGDGYVEIENVKLVGGTSVAVATDEAGRSGRPDAWKRERLIQAGADFVIPDFRDWEMLFRHLWGEN